MNLDPDRFSEREKEVIALLLQGKSNKQIALALRIAQSTVEYHLKNIYQKLDVGSRTEAVLRLGKTTSTETPGEGSESTTHVESQHSGSDAQPISIPNIPRNTKYWGIGLFVATVIVIMLFYFYNRSAQNTEPSLCALPAPDFMTASAPPHPTSPAWQDQIFYEVSPYKFDDGDPTNNDPEKAFEKGDIAGIRQQMHYLKGLGVTSLLFGPVFRAPYEERIDPILGTNTEFEQLIAEVHSTANGPSLNFILELRFSTTEPDHPWTQNPGYYLAWNGENPGNNLGCDAKCEPYLLPDGTPVDHSPEVEALDILPQPMLNQTSGMDNERGAYDEITDTIFWLVDTFKIDGFRYGTAHFYCATFWPEFMRDFRERYGNKKPDFWHIAEVLIFPGQQKSWQIPKDEFIDQTSSVGPIQMDGAYDFDLSWLIQNTFAKGQDPCITDVCARLMQHLIDPQGVKHPERLLASVDNLFLSFLQAVEDGNKKERLHLASAFLLTSNRVPLIHSGNEYGMDYLDPGALFSGSVDQAFHEEFKTVVKIRRDHAAFRRGSLIPLNTTASIISFARQYEGKLFIVVLNIDEDPSPNFEIDLASKGIACHPVTNLLEENDPGIQPGDAGITVTLGAWEAKIIQCE